MWHAGKIGEFVSLTIALLNEAEQREDESYRIQTSSAGNHKGIQIITDHKRIQTKMSSPGVNPALLEDIQ